VKFLGKLFATGLLTVVPIVATAYLLWWLFSTAENFFGKALFGLIPPQAQFPGLGIVLGVLCILGVGLLMRAWVVQALFNKIEAALMAIPLVKSIYSAIRDFFGLVANDENGDNFQVVAYTVPGTRARLIGFVTRKSLDDLPEGLARPGEVTVYFPMSYQVGGYTACLPAEELEAVDMPREAAMRFVITAGVNASGSQNGK